MCGHFSGESMAGWKRAIPERPSVPLPCGSLRWPRQAPRNDGRGKATRTPFFDSIRVGAGLVPALVCRGTRRVAPTKAQ